MFCFYFVSFWITTVVKITQILLYSGIKTVYKIMKYITNYLYPIDDYTVISWIINVELS